MQDIERAEPRLMTTPGPGEFPQNSRPETSRIDWFHKCIDLSIGRPTSIPFSADGFVDAGTHDFAQASTPVSSCRARDSSHNIVHGSQVHYVKHHLLQSDRALSSGKHLAASFL